MGASGRWRKRWGPLLSGNPAVVRDADCLIKSLPTQTRVPREHVIKQRFVDRAIMEIIGLVSCFADSVQNLKQLLKLLVHWESTRAESGLPPDLTCPALE